MCAICNAMKETSKTLMFWLQLWLLTAI